MCIQAMWMWMCNSKWYFIVWVCSKWPCGILAIRQPCVLSNALYSSDLIRSHALSDAHLFGFHSFQNTKLSRNLTDDQALAFRCMRSIQEEIHKNNNHYFVMAFRINSNNNNNIAGNMLQLWNVCLLLLLPKALLRRRHHLVMFNCFHFNWLKVWY